MTIEQDGHGDHVAITIDDPGLPEDDADRKAVLSDLQDALARVTEQYDDDTPDPTVIDGDMRSQLYARCPKCSDEVELQNVTPQGRNGATAPVSCDCGWNGEAVYRLVNLVEDVPDDADLDALPDEAVHGYVSGVGKYGIEPMYIRH